MSDTIPPGAPQVDEEAIRRVGRKLVEAFRGPDRKAMDAPQAVLLAAVLLYEHGYQKLDAASADDLARWPVKLKGELPIAFAAAMSGNAHRVEHALAAHKAGTKRIHKTGEHHEYEALADLVRT